MDAVYSSLSPAWSLTPGESSVTRVNTDTIPASFFLVPQLYFPLRVYPCPLPRLSDPSLISTLLSTLPASGPVPLAQRRPPLTGTIKALVTLPLPICWVTTDPKAYMLDCSSVGPALPGPSFRAPVLCMAGRGHSRRERGENHE